jgi:hypothetical protein
MLANSREAIEGLYSMRAKQILSLVILLYLPQRPPPPASLSTVRSTPSLGEGCSLARPDERLLLPTGERCPNVYDQKVLKITDPSIAVR